MFITFEGIDGSGKSTQIGLLAAHLRESGRQVAATFEPGDGSLGRELRPILLDLKNSGLCDRAELFLYLADRAQHVSEVIAPALRGGAVVLCDRFVDSTLAYQGYGRGLDLAMLRELNALAVAGTAPDLTLVLDLAPQVGLARAKARNLGAGAQDSEGRFEALALDFHNRVRGGYLELAKGEPERIRVVDAGRRPGEIFEDVRCLVDEKLGGAR
ncbi:MAG: dTMP kinase [Desulfovibrionaceae bacterium]|nr:dTMP kinase [Desulfovibrionaceae bacterium]MBF0514525.1 dTMP kinase [Desulfovibrionaceae bacterium]